MLTKLPLSWTIGVSLVALAVIPELVLFYIKRFRRLKPDMPPKHVNEVMFFAERSNECGRECFKRSKCSNKDMCFYQCIRKLAQLVKSSCSTLDVCIYLMTAQEIGDAIISAFNKGVKVRVITDCEMAYNSASEIRKLRQHGIPVRVKQSNFLMHHKFAVIDNTTLITGSCNWTLQGFTANWDNIIVTTVPELVQPFSHHFTQLWEEFSEIQLDQ